MNVIDFIPFGKQNAITQNELMMVTGLSDRMLREEISRLRRDVPILNMQDGKGYFRPTEDEIEDVFTMKGHKLSKEQCKRISEFHKGKCLSEETKQKMSNAKKRGGIGHKKSRKDGYIAIYFPDHPQSSNEGYIMEHVLVMEGLLGRHLSDEECVHHLNENRSDNRKENLKLMTKSEHMSFHSKKRWERRKNA